MTPSKARLKGFLIIGVASLVQLFMNLGLLTEIVIDFISIQDYLFSLLDDIVIVGLFFLWHFGRKFGEQVLIDKKEAYSMAFWIIQRVSAISIIGGIGLYALFEGLLVETYIFFEVSILLIIFFVFMAVVVNVILAIFNAIWAAWLIKRI